MLKTSYLSLLLSFFFIQVFCQKQEIRKFHNSIGFAKNSWQMDSIYARIAEPDKLDNDQVYKAVINPHDDYKYAAGLYAKTLSGIKANTIVMVGVAHRASNFDLMDKLIFGSYDAWESPYGPVRISPIRNKLVNNLPPESYTVHNDMIQLEHSLEAILPFLQYQNRKIEIIPVLIPYMKFEDMENYSLKLSNALHKLMEDANLEYGRDLAIVISNDAIHYGSEDWGGSNLAPFGTSKEGNEKAHNKDMKIIQETLSGNLNRKKIQKFNKYTVQEDNYMNYNWTWCGRYSLPFGLLLADNLNQLFHGKHLKGDLIGYRSSLKDPHLKVEDLGMGVTAPAKPTHWVAYLGMAYQ